MKKKRKWINSFTVAMGLTFCSVLIYRADFQLFHQWELKSYDFKVRARGVRPVSGNVVIIAIDEKSLKDEGRWPWPRSKLANLVDRLSEAGVTVIGFDAFFPEKDTNIPFEAVQESLKKKDLKNLENEKIIEWLKVESDSDAKFADAIGRSGRTVLGFYIYPTEEMARQLSDTMEESRLQVLSFSSYAIVQRFDDPENPVPLRRVHGMGVSIPQLINVANSMGCVSFLPEVDGVVRWIPMVLEFDKVLYPPLSLQVVQQATQLPPGLQIAEYGVDSVRLGELVIPTNEVGDFLVNYYGPSHTFEHISATDVLSGKVGAETLQNKIVLVGGTAAGMHDIHTSPYGPLYPGVEVHANVIENFLTADFLVRPDWLAVLDLAMILISGLLLGLVSLYFRALFTAVILVFGIVGYIYSDYYLFTNMGLWVKSAYPIFTQIFVYSGITLYRFVFEEQEKRFVKAAFSQYLAPAVVERLMNNPTFLKLGGERKELTAFFSDVAGVSSISEKLSPGELVELLNVYLTEMTDIIMKYEGTVDKFEGDAIIAFFGAPVPYEDHAKRACLVCVEMQSRLKKLRQQWKEEGKHQLFVRIGLNTGPMVIGNMGSKNRMDYTMMGDSVNLAARLEGVNKQYGTYTMISEFTYRPAKEFIEARELDLIRVVGKSEPVKIYELLGSNGDVDEKTNEVLPYYNKGLEYYKLRRWDEAIESFEKALGIDVNDGPSLTYFERCILFKGMPPPDDWDGVFGMLSK